MSFDWFSKQTKAERQQQFFDYRNALREVTRSHGEIALLVGIVLGIVIVLFFKPLAIISAVVALAAYAVWYLSPDDSNGESVADEVVKQEWYAEGQSDAGQASNSNTSNESSSQPEA